MVGSYLGAWTRFRVDLGVDPAPRSLCLPRGTRERFRVRAGFRRTAGGMRWDWALVLLLLWSAIVLGFTLWGRPLASLFSHSGLFSHQARGGSRGRWQGYRGSGCGLCTQRFHCAGCCTSYRGLFLMCNIRAVCKTLLSELQGLSLLTTPPSCPRPRPRPRCRPRRLVTTGSSSRTPPSGRGQHGSQDVRAGGSRPEVGQLRPQRPQRDFWRFLYLKEHGVGC